jgi:ADP-heptose:LPS heptosyltransferase
MSIVIRSPNWIGDGIMSLPAIRACKKYFPSERLTVVVKEYLAAIFLHVAEIDEMITIPDRWSARGYVQSVRLLREKHFERGILFTNSFASAFFFACPESEPFPVMTGTRAAGCWKTKSRTATTMSTISTII